MAVIHMTVDKFENEVLKADKPVLVDFWASWCGPCKMLSPLVDEISEEVDNVKICKVNVDEEAKLAEKYKIMTIPTLLLFKDGEVVNKSIGLKSKAEIIDLLNV
jgi:thioredoxin 1